MSKNEEYLKKVINNPYVKLHKRIRKVENLKDENLLKHIAEHAQDPCLKKKAIFNNNLNSVDFLEDREKKEKNQGVQRALNFKIKKLKQ